MKTFAALLASAALCAAPAAHAADFGDAEVVADEELQDMRGGFIVAGGYQIDFGAIVRTFVDGELALETLLSWSEAGAVIERSYGQVGQPLNELANDAQSQLNLPGLSTGGSGIVLSDGQGATALIHRVIDGAFQNFVINDASGRDIRQEIELTITLPGFEASQDIINLDRLGLRIGDEIGYTPGF